jgi:uncharacterized glyoxalase superfamily protein PhnB
MQPLPNGWPRISSAIVYDDARAAINWLCKAFGFEVRVLVESSSGELVHDELVLGEGVIMVAQSGKRPHFKSPRSVGGNTQTMMVYVDDVEAHLENARKHGAEIFQEIQETDYGPEYWSDRTYGAIDPGGHYWWFAQRLKTGNPRWSEVRNKIDQSDHG